MMKSFIFSPKLFLKVAPVVAACGGADEIFKTRVKLVGVVCCQRQLSSVNKKRINFFRYHN